MGGCAVTAHAISRGTFGASAPIGPADDLLARDDCVPQVRCLRPLLHPGYLQLDAVVADVLEQASAGTEQHGHEVHVNLVDATSTLQLLADVGAEDVDILITAGSSC